jgi:SPOR domain
MADDNLRSYRGRQSLARDVVDPAPRQAASDPLEELARLIGQNDPYAERGRQGAYGSARPSYDAAPAGLEAAAGDSYVEAGDHGEDRFTPPPLPPESYATYRPQERSYENEPSGGGQYNSSSPAMNFDGFADDAGSSGVDDQRPISPPRPPPAFMSTASDEHYQAGELEHGGADAYGPEDYYDDAVSPRRGAGLIVVMAVLGLAVIGTAGAFGYRTMYGGSIWAGLPPIIKASTGPNKIMPSHVDSQVSNSGQSGASNTGSTEKLVSREEQPVNVEPPKVAPRVVATIPITTAQGPVPQVAASAAPAPAAAAPNPGPSPAPPPPMPATAAAGAALSTSAPPASAAPMAAAAPPVSPEPKKVHTVTIRADQPSGSDAQPATSAPAPAPPVHHASRQIPPAPKPGALTASNVPLSIVPGAEGDVPAQTPPRVHTAAAPMAVASADPATGVASTPAAGGRYAVQVTSQHNEADAKASFKELRAKFPSQLSGREPIIRRADLGAKGVYYRALVGPFASMEEAAGMCSSLKAAGGNCIVQRN